jgi:redox-sensitive bicupin YhaK (pirin superfamily)
VSNLEQRPAETRCGAAVVPHPRSGRRVLAPREVPLGGPRAMLVRRTLPHRELRTVGAWCFLDDYGPHEVGAGNGMRVPPHPHTGLQTVTWLLDGEVRHQDSLGSDQIVRPGELNLMTAGRGISHAETSPAASTGALRGLQLWVALPSRHRDTAPDFAHHAGLPVVTGDGLAATVLLGSLAGASSAATTFSPIVGAEVSLAPSATVALPLERDFEHALLALSDDLRVDGHPLDRSSLEYLATGRSEVLLAAGPTGDRLLLLGGEPFDEELLMWWNFVARSHDEVVEAREEWMAAVDGASTRFGQVSSYDGAALPAPVLPATRLRPRGSS